MARYYRVSPRFWIDAAEWPDDDRQLGLYVLTCEHRNLEGLYRLPQPYVASDLGWPLPRVARALKRLAGVEFIAYDTAVQVIFVRNALKYQAPSTAKQLAGALASLEDVPPTPLWERLLIASESHCPSLADAIRDRFPMRFGSHSHSRARAALALALTPTTDSGAMSEGANPGRHQIASSQDEEWTG